MKRFVKEFGKAMYDQYYKVGKENPNAEVLCTYKCKRVFKVLNACEKGLMTDYEAVKQIVKICEEE